LKTIALVFSYEELNINVLLNSVLWNQKKSEEFRYVAYVPTGFRTLFFSADEIVEIPREMNDFKKYSEVSEYFESAENFTDKVKKRIKVKLRDYVILSIKVFDLKNRSLIYLLNRIPTPRAEKFLHKSGSLKWVKRDVRSRYGRSALVVVAQNNLCFEGVDIKFQGSSLGESFDFLFKEHHKAISAGLRIELDRTRENQKGVIEIPKRVIFRTRNYSLKQPEHNTKIEDILPLVKCFIQNGWEVINVGSPALPLESELRDGEAAVYREFSNVLTIDEEFDYLAYPIVCRADAGLFVLAAALNTPLLLLSDEWSARFGINLTEARAQSGAQYDQIEVLERQPQDVVDRLTKCYGNI
jgi:hypothetical protein